MSKKKSHKLNASALRRIERLLKSGYRPTRRAVRVANIAGGNQP